LDSHIFIYSVFVCIVTDNGLTVLENLSICVSIYFTLSFLDISEKKSSSWICCDHGLLYLPDNACYLYHEYTKDDFFPDCGKNSCLYPRDYFTFALPAIVAMAIGFRIPLGKLKINSDPTGT